MRALILIATLTAIAFGVAASSHAQDRNVAMQLQRQADELAAIRRQQEQQYYEMKERQERQDFDDRMRRTYPNWGR